MKKSLLAFCAVFALALIGFGALTLTGHPAPGDLLGATLAPDALHSLGLAAALPFAGKTKFFRVATEGATTDGAGAWPERLDKLNNVALRGAV